MTFRRVLIANRGEIAVRIIRTVREMGLTSLAVYSDADRGAPFTEVADEAYHLGAANPADSYLNIQKILEVARQVQAEAVHPGYGFLAENADFAAAVIAAGLTFIGPGEAAIRLMGDKVAARRAVQQLGVPVVPGTLEPVGSVEEAERFAAQFGYPIAIKAAGGGGGRGIRVVRDAVRLAESLEAASREAGAYFKNPQVYLERYFDDPRHVEIQVLADGHGTIIHLGERDCSVQRRHQKLIEESPSPAVDRALRERMGAAAILAAQSARYVSAGTVEFLLTREGEFYFLEMNTRIQVEHPVTEMVTGIDLIREMVLVAAGEQLSVPGSVLDPSGHAIEVRVNAEDPARDFIPTPGPIGRYREPGGIGTRVDSGVTSGFTVPSAYDSLLAKVIAWAPDRDRARARILRALGEYEIEGPATTIPFACAVINHPTFAEGEVGTAFLAGHSAEILAGLPQQPPTEPAAATPTDRRSFEVEVNRRLFRVSVAELRDAPVARRAESTRRGRARAASGDVISPMHGSVVAVRVSAGETVARGQTLFVLEAMKMENELKAERNGVVKSIDAKVGDTVEAGQRLAAIE